MAQGKEDEIQRNPLQTNAFSPDGRKRIDQDPSALQH
jgi:hypothetical protein